MFIVFVCIFKLKPVVIHCAGKKCRLPQSGKIKISITDREERHRIYFEVMFSAICKTWPNNSWHFFELTIIQMFIDRTRVKFGKNGVISDHD